MIDVAGVSILVARDLDDRIHAHANVCRHRGARLCENDSDSTQGSLMCSYHAWIYALDGRLIATPHLSASEVDEDALSLWWVAVAEGFRPIGDRRVQRARRSPGRQRVSACSVVCRRRCSPPVCSPERRPGDRFRRALPHHDGGLFGLTVRWRDRASVDTLRGMCRRVTCKTCGKPSWAGCGAHVEQVLRDVARQDRCPGHTKAEAAAATTPKRRWFSRSSR